MIQYIIFYMLSCLSPQPGWYQVTYERVSGDCGDLPSHKQHFSNFNNVCSMNVKINKKFLGHDATFDGIIEWDVDGRNVRGDGDVEIKSKLTGNECSGHYRAKLSHL